MRSTACGSARHLCVLVLMLAAACGPALEPETHVYKTVDGEELLLDVHRPAQPNGTTLFWIHGGGLISGSRRDIPDDELGWFLERGYTLVLPDYRLAPETTLPGIYEDIADAYAWTRGARGVDAERIVVLGQSAGGYLALSSAVFLEHAPRAIVSFYGYGRVDGSWVDGVRGEGAVGKGAPRTDALLRSTAVDDASEGRSRILLNGKRRLEGDWTRSVVGEACAAGDAACLRTFNPEAHVSAQWPATILLHGRLDEDVPDEESLLMARRFTAHGVRHELHLVDRKHGFDLDGPRDPVVVRCFEFVDTFLRAELARP